MTIDPADLLNSILQSISRIDYIKTDDIPNIDLYMDQVTTFMEDHLKSSRRHPEDKILTKTMINNYAKNDLLPPPVKKKYSKEHLLVMVFIYYFKNLLTITDIQALLKPLTTKYFQRENDFNLETIYNEVFRLEQTQVDRMIENITESYQLSQTTFTQATDEDQEFLKLFSFICLLSFDVYVKKQVIEKLIDSLPDLPDTSLKK